MKRKTIGYKDLYTNIEKEWKIYKPYHNEVFKLTGGSQYVDPKSPLAFASSEVFETKVNEYLYKIKKEKSPTQQGIKLLDDLRFLTQSLKNETNKGALEIAERVLLDYTTKWLNEYLPIAKGKITGKKDVEFINFLSKYDIKNNQRFWTAFRMSGHHYFQPMTNWENYRKLDYNNAKLKHLQEYVGDKYGGQTWYSERVMAFFYEIWSNESYREMISDGINYKTMKKVRERINKEYNEKKKQGNE